MGQLFLPINSPIIKKDGNPTDPMVAWMRQVTQQVPATGGSITSLTGDVTATGPGAAVATISANAVTFAKMQNISTQVAIGRNTAGTGDPEEVTISQMLDWTP